jgi:hypothetical protein
MPPPQPEPPVVSKAEEAPVTVQTKPEARTLPKPEEPAPKPPATPSIIVTEPQDGAILQMARGDSVTIRGTVDDPGIEKAIVTLNKTRIEVDVHEGRFEAQLPGVGEDNRLHVEATNSSGLTGHSASVHFLTRQPQPKDVLAVLSYKAVCADLTLTALKGDSPLSRSYRPFKPPMAVESASVDFQTGAPYVTRVMAISESESGVYTIRLDADPSHSAADCDPRLFVLLYGYSREKLRMGLFQKPMPSQSGTGPWILARFLMPQGLFWDDDTWTTGRIEDGRSVTKFSSSLGIVWKELK